MTEKPKKELTDTAIGRIVEAEVKEEIAELKRVLEERDSRPSRAAEAVKASLDFTKEYPKTSVSIGLIIIAASLALHAYKLIGDIPMYVLWGIAVGFVPGLGSRVVEIAQGLRKAKTQE
jgi:hypothetical protein